MNHGRHIIVISIFPTTGLLLYHLVVSINGQSLYDD